MEKSNKFNIGTNISCNNSHNGRVAIGTIVDICLDSSTYTIQWKKNHMVIKEGIFYLEEVQPIEIIDEESKVYRGAI